MMSTSPSVDAYDAQMLDFSLDPDVPMHMTGAAEFFAEALMDHDGHLATSAYSDHPSVEVDMEEYVGDNAEFEMGDETAEYPHPHGNELLDVEVYDASHAPSPLVSPRPLQPPADVPIDSERPPRTSSPLSKHTAVPESQGEPQSEGHPAPPDHPAADISHVEPSVTGEVALEPAAPELVHPSDSLSENLPLVSESHEQLGDSSGVGEQLPEARAPTDVDDTESRTPPVAEEPVANSGVVVSHENSGPQTAESASLPEDVHDIGNPVQNEKATDQAPVTEEESVDLLHISDDVYIDPPPSVLLSVDNLSESGFALFNLPDVEGEHAEESSSGRKTYSVLLENQPTLYYEPLSSVFEALRQDEDLLSRLPHSFEGELVLDAYDLQLAVSEDNVHSREISLHDLNILHDGSDFVGPLRLLLRTTIPRFIIRYYALQEQIQRLHLSAEPREGEHDYEHHEHYSTVGQPLPQQQEGVGFVSTQAAAVSGDSEVPPATEVEEPIKESVLLDEPTKEMPQEKYEAVDTTQEPSVESHELARETARSLEDENGYEGTDVNDEHRPAGSDSLDADRAHDVEGDTDAPATVTGQGSEFGGEHTEYLDYVHPEEYDERYGEEPSERAEGGSPTQYGEPSHYEEEGEQDPSTAVDRTQTILPGSDEDEEGKSVATPTPARPVLEAESERADLDATKELSSSQQENPAPSSEELANSEPKDEADYALQVSGKQEPSTDQARIFSEIDESDSNFVSILEREADAEFDRSFNVEHNGQEGSSIEATLQHNETWDEWDDEDAEGDNEEDWIDPDADSNESSITLSSKASSKRNYDEVDPNEESYLENPQNSPGLKRPRVQ